MQKIICEECQAEDDTTAQNEFGKLLCDDCYTEYRITLQNMFNLKDLFEVDGLLSSIRKGGFYGKV
jgi:hypothetical protein